MVTQQKQTRRKQRLIFAGLAALSLAVAARRADAAGAR